MTTETQLESRRKSSVSSAQEEKLVPIHAGIERQDFETLNEIAAEAGESRSSLVRQAISFWLDNYASGAVTDTIEETDTSLLASAPESKSESVSPPGEVELQPAKGSKKKKGKKGKKKKGKKAKGKGKKQKKR